MQFAVMGKPFNGCYITTISLYSKHGAALGSFAIYMNGAGAATAGIAANMCACKPQHIPQVMHKQQAWFNFIAVCNAVDSKINFYIHEV